MKTAVMFCGVDALDIREQRHEVLLIEEVQQRILRAQEVLSNAGQGTADLISHIQSDDSIFHANLPLKAFASSVVQVGLYDKYIKYNNQPDYLVGCSLSDAARTVCSGALSFEKMVMGTFIFNSVGQTIKGGAASFASELTMKF